MKIILWAVVVCAAVAPAQNTPRMSSAAKHIFKLGGRLTEASGGDPQQAAMDYLRQLAPAYGLSDDDLTTAYVAQEYRTAHNGVTHLLFRQKFDGAAVENAEWVANVDREGRLINVGGRLYPRPPAGWSLPDAGESISAVRAAAAAVNPRLAAGYSPFAKSASARQVSYSSDGFGADLDGTAAWYAVNGKVYPVWRFHVVDRDGRHGYDVMVESRSQRVLAKQPATLFFEDSPQPPRGLVYDFNPQPDVKPGVLSTTPPPVVERALRSFAGDPAASPKGWVAGSETAGNNVVAGTNPSAVECVTGVSTCLARPTTSTSATRDFSFPLQLGASAPAPSAFPDAAVTNLFYWINRAHDLHYALGFDEAAGNFQEDNFGKAGAGGDAVYAYAQEGSAARGGAILDNSNFGGVLGISGITQDGVRPRMGLFVSRFGGIFTDPDLDAEVILHEYTHGVSARLVPQLYETEQGASMGEAWSDFFALEFTTPEGAPADGGYDMGAYFSQSFGYGIRTLPYSTDFTVNPLTYADLGHVIYEPEAHADGQIWVEALWQARAALIQQFGEPEGRRRVRLLAIDSMKLSPPAPSMVDARDAFLLADQVDFDGASQTQLWAAFAKRGLGALAQSDDGNSIHISPSFDVPSKTGALGFYESSYVIGETVRIVLADANLTTATAHVQLTSSSGDLENVELQRTGLVYTGAIAATYAPAFRGDSVLQLAPGDSLTAYYVDLDTGNGAKLIQK
ncbi:MAG: M36 family metallopeptidase, partial [Bryobacteraceae bacterium]